MAIPEGYKLTLETLKRAAGNDDLAIMECQDKITKKVVYVLCAVNQENGEYAMVPMAKLFDGNPYEELNPPAAGGGFEDTSVSCSQETPTFKGPEDYQVVDGFYFDKRTSRQVIDVLLASRGTTIRIHYGYTEADSEDGKVVKDWPVGQDWMDENDVTGRIGRSSGSIKVPLIVPDSDSGGPSILDHCIVRIRTLGKNGRDLYRHPKYSWGKLTMGPVKSEGYAEAVYSEGHLHAQFKKPGDAQRWAEKNGWRIE